MQSRSPSDPRGRACRTPADTDVPCSNIPALGGAGPSGTADRGREAHRAPGRYPADTSRKIPVRPPLIRGDEYCGTRFRSSRREARSIGTRPSNPASLPYGARRWPIEADDCTPRDRGVHLAAFVPRSLEGNARTGSGRPFRDPTRTPRREGRQTKANSSPPPLSPRSPGTGGRRCGEARCGTAPRVRTRPSVPSGSPQVSGVGVGTLLPRTASCRAAASYRHSAPSTEPSGAGLCPGTPPKGTVQTIGHSFGGKSVVTTVDIRQSSGLPLGCRREVREARQRRTARMQHRQVQPREKEEDAIRIARERTFSPGTADPGTEGGPTVTHPRSPGRPAVQ